MEKVLFSFKSDPEYAEMIASDYSQVDIVYDGSIYYLIFDENEESDQPIKSSKLAEVLNEFQKCVDNLMLVPKAC